MPASATSWKVWSNPRCMNVEYSVANGLSPVFAMPAHMSTACDSAMPTSKVRSGKASITWASPVPSGMPAVTLTTFESRFITSIKASE